MMNLIIQPIFEWFPAFHKYKEMQALLKCHDLWNVKSFDHWFKPGIESIRESLIKEWKSIRDLVKNQ